MTIFGIDIEVGDILSGFAVGLSIFTLYWTTLRGSRLDAPGPRTMGLMLPYGEAEITIPCIGFTFFIANSGAKSAHIDHLFIVFENKGNDETRFNCRHEMLISKFIGELHERVSQDDAAMPFSIAPNSSVTKNFIFIIDEDEEMSSFRLGKSIIKVYAVLLRQRPTRLLAGKLKTVKLCLREIELKLELKPKGVVTSTALKESAVILFDPETFQKSPA